MKKLSNKQKLISGIAIILVVVIFAIIITTKVINNGLGSEKYSSNNSNIYSNLIANYIKKGITIGGITGTLETLDTSDATAVPEDILWGKTGYVKGNKITGTKVVTVAQGKESQIVFEKNTVLIDDYGNDVKVPAGFKISLDSSTKVTEGVVIEDVNAGDTNSKGNQFVWIPIGKVYYDENKNYKNITLGRYIFNEKGEETLIQNAKDYAKETPLKVDDSSEYEYREFLKTTNSINTKAKDIEDFVKKTLNSNGYYLARYEAGDAMATTTERTVESSDTNPVVSKKGVYPYNYIVQSQASDLARTMYNNNNFESDLINSYSWDTAIIFIQAFSGDIDYSMQGCLETELEKTGEATDGKNYDIRCNIYDMGGNVSECSTENYSHDWAPVSDRGAGYDIFAANNVSWRNQINEESVDGGRMDGFRCILYL